MEWIEIPLNNLRYRFRKLTWREEVALAKVGQPVDESRRAYLAAALAEIANPHGQVFSIATREDALKVVTSVPTPILHRLWVVYRASLPPNSFFKTKGLYSAPEARIFQRVIDETVVQNEDRGSAAVRDAEKKFGLKAVAESREIENQILADAKKRGVLRPTTEAD